jgi:predicted RNA-binding Zn-ribbon protein involved in translation (DUF1610 family)
MANCSAIGIVMPLGNSVKFPCSFCGDAFRTFRLRLKHGNDCDERLLRRARRRTVSASRPQTWVNTHKIRVIRLHYDADPKKGDGEKVFVPQINRDLSPWAKAEFDRTTDANNFLREYEIDSNAKSGQLVYQLHREATLEQSFAIPKHWTSYWGLDPHQRRPHASSMDRCGSQRRRLRLP